MSRPVWVRATERGALRRTGHAASLPRTVSPSSGGAAAVDARRRRSRPVWFWRAHRATPSGRTPGDVTLIDQHARPDRTRVWGGPGRVLTHEREERHLVPVGCRLERTRPRPPTGRRHSTSAASRGGAKVLVHAVAREASRPHHPIRLGPRPRLVPRALQMEWAHSGVTVRANQPIDRRRTLGRRRGGGPLASQLRRVGVGRGDSR